LIHSLFKIKGVVQHYSWGGYEYIPALLGIDNSVKKPFAEYWLGAHPNHPSCIEGSELSLSEFISEQPGVLLGPAVGKHFSSLPFLFKVLDVRQMLSIQVHPSKESAIKEFALENEKGIPVNAPHRNYKDENHKPELMVALGDFWLLHGFKSETQLKDILRDKPAFNFLLNVFGEGNYRALYESVMTMEQEKVDEVLRPLLQPLVPLYEKGQLKKESEDFWAARAVSTFCKDGHYDKGIFSIYFFNLVHLRKGEGIFQPQGMPHAYLEGQNVEVMANSDNVLRAGLTDKHIDVKELLKHVDFKATVPAILPAGNDFTITYQSPAEEFELHAYHFKGQKETISSQSPEIWFILSGTASVTGKDATFEMKRGEAVFLGSGEDVTIESGNGEVFRCIVPVQAKN
jgi:mannose-6-phosphate isomerase